MTPPTVQFIPAAGGGFLPSDLASLDAWYDASNASTIVESGGYISAWKSASGVANDLAQANGANQPLLNTGNLNSLDTAYFDGGDFMIASITSGMTSASCFVVLERTAAGRWVTFNGNGPFLLVAQSGSTAAISNASGTPIYYYNGDASGWVNRDDVYTDLGPGTGWAIVSMTDVNFNSWGNFAPSGFSGYRFIGDFAEIILFDSSLGTSDRQKVEGYLAHKWGLTAKLPASHPYKSAAP